MATLMPKCRGFTHPFLLLVRSTLRTRASLELSTRTTTTNSSWRSFTSARALLKKTNMPSKTPLADIAKIIHTDRAHLSYIQRLAMKSNPQTLYEAAPQKGFLLSSYAAGFTCFGSAAINSYLNVWSLPVDISPWVPIGFTVISTVFVYIGSIFALRPAGVIRSIKVVPQRSRTDKRPPQSVMLEVTARRLAPLPLPLKRFKVLPEHVVMVNRMHQRPVVFTEEQTVAQKLAESKRRKEQLEFDRDHRMTLPFRELGRAGGSLFRSIRQGLTGEGFSLVFIEGKKFKLDADGGYALENGQVLDRIVKIQPDAKLARTQSIEWQPTVRKI